MQMKCEEKEKCPCPVGIWNFRIRSGKSEHWASIFFIENHLLSAIKSTSYLSLQKKVSVGLKHKNNFIIQFEAITTKHLVRTFKCTK